MLRKSIYRNLFYLFIYFWGKEIIFLKMYLRPKKKKNQGNILILFLFHRLFSYEAKVFYCIVNNGEFRLINLYNNREEFVYVSFIDGQMFWCRASKSMLKVAVSGLYRRSNVSLCVGHSLISRLFFFVQVFKIVVDSWKFSMVLLYILWDDWPIFMISRLNEQLQQQLEYTLLKPECHRCWISKMQSDALQERYAIKLCFKLGKMPQKSMKCFRLLFDHLAWIEHQFLSGVRDSRKAGSLWEMMRAVGRVRKSIHKSWLAKRLGFGLGLLCWGFKGVQEEIPSEEASTLQIGSVAFPPGQYTSPQLHRCHRLFDQDGHQDTSSASLQSRPCSLWLLVIP